MRNYENESANYTLENGLFESQRQFAIDQHAILSNTNILEQSLTQTPSFVKLVNIRRKKL